MKENSTLTVFTMENCPKCPGIKKLCENIAKELKLDFKIIDIKKDPLEGLMYQVMETPSIALNDETLFFGETPTKNQIKKEIKNKLS